MKITYWDCPYNDYCELVDPGYKYGCLHPNGSGICTKLDYNAGFDCDILDDTLIDNIIYEDKWL